MTPPRSSALQCLLRSVPYTEFSVYSYRLFSSTFPSRIAVVHSLFLVIPSDPYSFPILSPIVFRFHFSLRPFIIKYLHHSFVFNFLCTRGTFGFIPQHRTSISFFFAFSYRRPRPIQRYIPYKTIYKNSSRSLH